MRYGRIDLVHPFLAALARSPVLAAAQIELFSDFSPLVRHLGLAFSRDVLACNFSQNGCLRVSPIFLGAHYVLSKLPSLLTLMNRAVWNEFADDVPLPVRKIFRMSPVLFDLIENFKLEQPSFISTPLGLG